MSHRVVPEHHALMQKIAAIEQALEEKYKDRLAHADPEKTKSIRKKMDRELEQAVDEATRDQAWWRRLWPKPWIR